MIPDVLLPLSVTPVCVRGAHLVDVAVVHEPNDGLQLLHLDVDRVVVLAEEHLGAPRHEEPTGRTTSVTTGHPCSSSSTSSGNNNRSSGNQACIVSDRQQNARYRGKSSQKNHHPSSPSSSLSLPIVPNLGYNYDTVISHVPVVTNHMPETSQARTYQSHANNKPQKHREKAA